MAEAASDSQCLLAGIPRRPWDLGRSPESLGEGPGPLRSRRDAARSQGCGSAAPAGPVLGLGAWVQAAGRHTLRRGRSTFSSSHLVSQRGLLGDREGGFPCSSALRARSVGQSAGSKAALTAALTDAAVAGLVCWQNLGIWQMKKMKGALVEGGPPPCVGLLEPQVWGHWQVPRPLLQEHPACFLIQTHGFRVQLWRGRPLCPPPRPRPVLVHAHCGDKCHSAGG